MRIIQMCGKAPTADGIPTVAGAERWVIGSAYAEQPDVAVSRLFDVHPPAWLLARRPEAWMAYALAGVPVYLAAPHPGIPFGVVFSFDAVRERFGRRASRAFSSSVDHMMAQALLEGCDQIRLDGVRLDSVEEWVLQRECLAYWIARAEGMGIEVATDDEAALVTPETVYGTDEKTGAERMPGRLKVVYGCPGVLA